MIAFEDFLKVDLRVGRITHAELNPKAQKPAFALKIDFGKELGELESSAQLTQNYTSEHLLGKQVVAVVNFPPKRIAGVRSQVLVLAAVCDNSGVVLLGPDQDVAVGTRIL
jgi:tRNA-binding protein